MKTVNIDKAVKELRATQIAYEETKATRDNRALELKKAQSLLDRAKKDVVTIANENLSVMSSSMSRIEVSSAAIELTYLGDKLEDQGPVWEIINKLFRRAGGKNGEDLRKKGVEVRMALEDLEVLVIELETQIRHDELRIAEACREMKSKLSAFTMALTAQVKKELAPIREKIVMVQAAGGLVQGNVNFAQTLFDLFGPWPAARDLVEIREKIKREFGLFPNKEK